MSNYDHYKSTNPDDVTLPSTHPNTNAAAEDWADRMFGHLERLLLNKNISNADYAAAIEEIIRKVEEDRRSKL